MTATQEEMTTTRRMDPEVKQAWVAALRSGEFEQGRGQLRQGDEYCCLGVLSELAVRAGVIPAAENIGDREYRYGETGLLLPMKVMEWSGIDSANPSVPDPEGRQDEVRLSMLNDGDVCSSPGCDNCRKPYTFEQIADLIEREL